MADARVCSQTSCFCAAQFLTAYCWGLASDRIGRKVRLSDPPVPSPGALEQPLSAVSLLNASRGPLCCYRRRTQVAATLPLFGGMRPVMCVCSRYKAFATHTTRSCASSVSFWSVTLCYGPANTATLCCARKLEVVHQARAYKLRNNRGCKPLTTRHCKTVPCSFRAKRMGYVASLTVWKMLSGLVKMLFGAPWLVNVAHICKKICSVCWTTKA